MADDMGSPGETDIADTDPVDPSAEFVQQANVADAAVYDTFEADWPTAWERAAAILDWDREWETVLDGEEPPFAWFAGGQLNASANCVDRHLPERKNQRALVWAGRLGEKRTYTYLELHREVNEFAAALRDMGVGEDDVVTLYLPMIPELPVAMLACTRIGAVHNVVFAGFSADALQTRMDSADSAVLVTCDGYYRRGSAVTLKPKADTARVGTDREVESVVVDRLGDVYEPPLGEHEHRYDDLLAAHAGDTVEPVARDAGDDLFRIYTSGTSGEPKAVTHTTGGYLSYVAWTAHSVLDVKPRDTYWCTADIGWITGHSYVVYGPLSLGTTTVLYEGAPDHPEKDRIWEIASRNAVDVFYTSPTAIRAFMKWGPEYPEAHDLSSLRLLGTVGEPINPGAWHWYHEHVGDGDCPIVDTWWQTETGGMMISTLPAVDGMKPGSAGRPLPGISAAVIDRDGESVAPGEDGYLVVDRPWPGMPQELLEDKRWARAARESAPAAESFDWVYSTEDGATVDEDGYVTILGRVDDVITVSGYRFGTAELESAIVDVEGVAEAAVVSGQDRFTGDSVYAFVCPTDAASPSEALREAILAAVEAAIGPIAKPAEIVFAPDLPKTRSGKIMRRLLEDVANGEELGDTSALRNPEVVGELDTELDD
ncbi:acetate--CoA ligase [Halobacteriales archaeon Cl-PHB]